MTKEFRLFGGTIRTALVHAVTAYDRKQSTKRGYNVYALGQYLARVDEVMADIEAGANPRDALLAAMGDRLLDHCLKAIGEPKYTRDEMNRQGYVYQPVKA